MTIERRGHQWRVTDPILVVDVGFRCEQHVDCRAITIARGREQQRIAVGIDAVCIHAARNEPFHFVCTIVRRGNDQIVIDLLRHRRGDCDRQKKPDQNAQPSNEHPDRP